MNNVILVGYLGSDADSRTTRNDSTLTTLSLATQRIWKDRESGERQSQTTWHRLVTFGRLANYAATLTKGANLQITGELNTREYTTKDGIKKSITEIRVRRITHLKHSPKQEVAA
ncbi:single-stranded DNA-binding protein [Bryobacter aggregatus]|uniref:single-stranded DNA-binding protein n=1 Tax=Bryobacter aggregatus TaxID=360054 RepID=UPI00068EE9C7|nr:single-stranded DNA-binding protein [Bryobacter aggregatus]